MPRAARLAAIRLTELNRTTTERFLACKGHHVPGEDWIERDFPTKRIGMRICVNCGVPIGSSKRWGDQKPEQ